MPSYEAGTSAMMYQFFPGELISAGSEGVGANGGPKSPVMNPGNFYSEPEWQQNREDATFRTHTVELRATLSLYNNSKGGEAMYPELDVNTSKAVYQSPTTWKDALVYFFEGEGEEPPPPTTKIHRLTLVGIG